ncbi:MAG: molybdopterin-dependent oxidoreductase, partial [Pseudomonadota bacterium]|nr:molybdopterin-dependent oxidoreductase [Pseudomonadota bacterium]
ADYNHQNWSLADIEQSDDIVLIGCNIRAEQPIIAHRIRQAATVGGTTVTDINFFRSDLLMPVSTHMTVNIKGMLSCLSGIAKALLALGGKEEKSWVELLENVIPKAADQTIAIRLSNARKATLFVGALANNHPQAMKLKALTALIARLTNSQLIILPAANSTAITLSDLLSKDKVKANEAESVGLNSEQIWQHKLRAYLLLGVEPELDCANPNLAQYALQHASLVVSITSYVTDTLLAYADVILPMASFAETSGTFIGIDGQWQSFTGAVTAKGDSRPGWKILRVLGNLADIKNFDYVSSQDVRDEVSDKFNLHSPAKISSYIPDSLNVTSKLMAISEVPMYQTDAVVRRSEPLQQTPENKRASLARMNSKEAEKHKLSEAKMIKVTQDHNHLIVAFEIDDAIADGCIYLAGGIAQTSMLGASFADVQIALAEQGAIS